MYTVGAAKIANTAASPSPKNASTNERLCIALSAKHKKTPSGLGVNHWGNYVYEKLFRAFAHRRHPF